MADKASRTSSSLNGLMTAVTSFMVSPIGFAGDPALRRVPPFLGCLLEGLPYREEDRSLSKLFLVSGYIGHVIQVEFVGIGVGVSKGKVKAAKHLGYADFVVGVVEILVVLDRLMSDVTDQHELPGQLVGQISLEVEGTLGVVRIGGIVGRRSTAVDVGRDETPILADAIPVCQRVRRLDVDPLPGDSTVDFRSVPLLVRGRTGHAVRIPDVDDAEVVAEVVVDLARVASVEVPFHVGVGVLGATDV